MHKILSCRFFRLSLGIKLGYAEPIVISDHVIISSSACEIIRVESLINVNIVAIKDTPTICKKRAKSMILENGDYFSP